jgi:phenylacetate-coenzyme A ligase PaaK-like adenylate-forming protein
MNREIPKTDEWQLKVFSISNEEAFRSIALEVYDFQYHNNLVYQNFCKAIQRTPDSVMALGQIPFLPISFFKTQPVMTTEFLPELIFKSSGTTGSISSTHLVKDALIYQSSFMRCFEMFYGAVDEYCVLGLLPSYLEKGESSLVYMVQHLIDNSRHPQSGFYLHNYEKLAKTLKSLDVQGQKTILFGVSYALLDLAAQFPLPLKNTVIIETGGMKGRKEEITKEDLYQQLQQAFSTSQIHSEYGMTEMLSQAYAINGSYKAPPWLKIFIRDETDPLSVLPRSVYASGGVNVIDLANIYSCSFIATEDVGRLGENNSFEVLGRMDNTDIRGCSQMVL